MVNNSDYTLNSVVEMRKPHPCAFKTKEFQIIRLGADIKIRCLGCGNVVMLERNDFNAKVRNVIKK